MQHKLHGCIAAILGVTVLAIAGGCQKQEQEKHYALRGLIVAKSDNTNLLSVDNDDIPGFMPAMTMPYPVKDPQGFAAVEPGDQITADVVVKSSDDYWLERVTITDKSARGSAPAATTTHELLPGEPVPDVPLINQDGKTLHLSQFKGKAVLLTFIYTRCPLPTFCPLISSEFAAIQKEMAETPEDYKKTHLVSISLDPDYDTPPVLRKYGLAYLLDDASGFAHWDFVATTPADLQKLASAFGLQYVEQNNQISHSMDTILLSSDGKVAETWPGNEWKTSEVAAALKKAAETKE
jgi:protein SCO1/2